VAGGQHDVGRDEGAGAQALPPEIERDDGGVAAAIGDAGHDLDRVDAEATGVAGVTRGARRFLDGRAAGRKGEGERDDASDVHGDLRTSTPAHERRSCRSRRREFLDELASGGVARATSRQSARHPPVPALP
jgi:hypothetical protein